MFNLRIVIQYHDRVAFFCGFCVFSRRKDRKNTARIPANNPCLTGWTLYLCVMDLIFDIEDILDTAVRFWLLIGNRKVIAFHGEMGAGKTTFIHALCDIKKVTSTVGSPTFSIINEYYYPGGKIYHLDLYRLKDEEEAVRAGVEDCLYSGETCFVEWPERALALFPEDALHVSIQITGASSRKISFMS
jgi:tRNA threonylcarbamoyladenosine biosynthesis protein TsaE